jgi:hypothetical protein
MQTATGKYLSPNFTLIRLEWQALVSTQVYIAMAVEPMPKYHQGNIQHHKIN